MLVDTVGGPLITNTFDMLSGWPSKNTHTPTYSRCWVGQGFDKLYIILNIRFCIWVAIHNILSLYLHNSTVDLGGGGGYSLYSDDRDDRHIF